MASKPMTLLGIDDLRMDEVPILERMSGYTLSELIELQQEGGGAPTGVLLGLAFLTERRQRPNMKKSEYLSLSTVEFMQRLSEKFETAPSDANYDAWTLDELKYELSQRGLAEHGRKQALIDRLREDDGEGSDGDPTKAA